MDTAVTGQPKGTEIGAKGGNVIQTRNLAHALTKQTTTENRKEEERTSDQRRLDKTKSNLGADWGLVSSKPQNNAEREEQKFED